MKPSTTEAKLNALLGLTKVAQEIKTRSTGELVGVTEEEIQEFREVQGFIYFLQAPQLFEAKVCKRCKESFLVSRKYVAYCSYGCIKESLAAVGIKWSKGDDLESLAVDPSVYHGNEPIWIRETNLKKAQAILETLLTTCAQRDSQSTSDTTEKSLPESGTGTNETTPLSSSSHPSTTMPQISVEVRTRSTKKNGVKRKVTFKTS